MITLSIFLDEPAPDDVFDVTTFRIYTSPIKPLGKQRFAVCLAVSPEEMAPLERRETILHAIRHGTHKLAAHLEKELNS